jgi:hypothetical protein
MKTPSQKGGLPSSVVSNKNNFVIARVRLECCDGDANAWGEVGSRNHSCVDETPQECRNVATIDRRENGR